MKLKEKFLFITVSFLMAVTPLFSENLNAVVDEIDGKVEYKSTDGVWKTLAVGDVLSPGDSISTGFNAKAVLVLGGTSVLVANSLTRLTLSELMKKEGTVVTDLFLDVGNIRTEVHSSDTLGNDFKVRNANSTASVRGTVIDVEVLGDGQGFKVMAWQGTANVTDLQTGSSGNVGESKEKYLKKEAAKEKETTAQTKEGASGDAAAGTGDSAAGSGEAAPPSGTEYGKPPEPSVQIASAPLIASGDGGDMVSSASSAISATSVTVSTKPPSPTSINTGGGSTAVTGSGFSTGEFIGDISDIPTSSNMSIQILFP